MPEPTGVVVERAAEPVFAAVEPGRDLDAAGELTLRVHTTYWSDHLDAVRTTGLRSGHGSQLVETAAIKPFTDGSFAGRTAELGEPYADAPSAGTDTGDGATRQWVLAPAELRELLAAATERDPSSPPTPSGTRPSPRRSTPPPTATPRACAVASSTPNC